MATWLASWFGTESAGKTLQGDGDISRDQLMQWFTEGKTLFSNIDFKMALALAHQQGEVCQDLINEAQAKIWEEKVSPPVQGDHGIEYLASVAERYEDDPEFLSMFYEFIHLEEKTLDEAELSQEQFTHKYTQLANVKAAMELQLSQKLGDSAALSEEEKAKLKMGLQKAMVETGLQMEVPSCCHAGTCSSGLHAQAGVSTSSQSQSTPPAPEDLPKQS